MKHKVLLQALGVEGADWRVVAHLLRYEPEAQILSGTPGITVGSVRGQTSIKCIISVKQVLYNPTYLTSS